MGDERSPHLRVRSDEVARRVLVVGDPGRAEQAAGRLDGVRRVAANREYATWTGELRGRRVTVASHGIGAAGAGICFEELARTGVKTIIRAGTCGALQADIGDGELVIATGAVRDDGLSPRLVPLSYPAVTDPRVVGALIAAAESAGVRCHRGVVLTSDLFYPSAALGGIEWTIWQQSRVVAVEMELAALLVIAALHGIAAGGILTVDGNPTRAASDMSQYDPHRQVVVDGTARMLEVALDALTGLDA